MLYNKRKMKQIKIKASELKTGDYFTLDEDSNYKLKVVSIGRPLIVIFENCSRGSIDVYDILGFDDRVLGFEAVIEGLLLDKQTNVEFSNFEDVYLIEK